MALLVVVVLGVPQMASAGQPAVQAPTGPQSGGVFTGVYTFDTYISCVGGASFNSSYSNNLNGTHQFAFYGAADGSLLVTIDGGGMMLVTSCGDPFAGPMTNVANYTVTECSGCTPPPTPSPTPSPTPTPTPTPTPGGGGGGNNGGSGSGGHQAGGGGSNSGPAAGGSTDSPAPPSGSDTPTPGASTAPATSAAPTASPKQRHINLPPAIAAPASSGLNLAWLGALLLLAALLIWFIVAWRRSQKVRDHMHALFLPVTIRLEPRLFRVRAFFHRLAPTIHGRDQPKRRGLAPHRHSGRIMAHHHTSYPALVFLLLLTGILAAAASRASSADSSATTLSLTVLGPPPTQAATIDDPTDGEHFSNNTQTVRGTCPNGLMVEIWRNGVFAGSTLCDINGLYAVVITLVPNANALVARDVDGLGQYGPDSGTVTVYYDVPPPPTPTPTPSATPTPSRSPRPSRSPAPSSTPSPAPTPTLLITATQHLYQGADTTAPVQWSVTIGGGRSPFQVTWDWGDGKSDSEYVNADGSIQMSHQYSKPGTYQVTVTAVDALGHHALLQVITVVNGAVTPASLGQANPESDGGNLIFVWPLLIFTGLMVSSFWLGERHKLAVWQPLHSAIGGA